MTAPQPDAYDLLRTLAVIETSRSRVAAALARRCSEHEAAPGAYCWSSRLSGVRGVCASRYSHALHAPSAQAAPPRTAAQSAPTRLDFRHPNRRPMTPIRTGAAR